MPCSCGNINNNPCNSCTTSITTPCVDVCTVPLYTDVNCPISTSDKCISYTGDNNTCFNIVKPITVKGVFDKIFLYIKTIFTNVTSNSLVVTASSLLCSPKLNIELSPSISPNNILYLNVLDGKPFVPNIKVVSGQYISFTKTIVNNEIIYTPVLNLMALSNDLCPLCDLNPSLMCTAPTDLIINNI